MAEKEGFWQLVRKGYQSMKEDFNPPKEETPKEVTEEISATELSIPMYYGMTDEEIAYVTDAVNSFR